MLAMCYRITEDSVFFRRRKEVTVGPKLPLFCKGDILTALMGGRTCST